MRATADLAAKTNGPHFVARARRQHRRSSIEQPDRADKGAALFRPRPNFRRTGAEGAN